ncbi:hypothetical protein NLJ89_g7483 [Agrocybe chaxingu]|uniref:Major facilitator superfamily (MFS) profile domain-containing protein n=1 Tax=Agrocybe chaxingu TaxID=84603 RepID=A0A9W8JX98_9AGAR|nr:hypothetical protein NLJ89_g7483 [Agrocybe chaxingu]
MTAHAKNWPNSATVYSQVEDSTVHKGTSFDHSSEITPLVVGPNKSLSKRGEEIGWIQFYALCYDVFLVGWNDGSLGPLLPRIQEFYGVGFATVSWIFVVACTGSVIGALMNMPLTTKFGFGKMLVFASLFQTAAFFVQSLALPFPLFVLSFFSVGIGAAIQCAQANGFVATLKYQAELKMGFVHAAYGCGALFAPLFATPLSQTKYWPCHYLISLGLSLINTVILALVFRFKDQDYCLSQAGEIIPNKMEDTPDPTYRELLKLKVVHLLALFLLVYVGIEVTIGGWIVSFMLIIRNGGPSSGYVASGFFGGLTLGRVALLWVNRKLGEIRAVYIYTVLVILFQLIVWLVPSIYAGCISVFCIGVLLGPLYPIAMNHISRVLPRALVTGAIGWVAACGSSGSALLPFFTGAMASKYGIQSLQPYLVVMMVLMGVLWKMVPKTAA